MGSRRGQGGRQGEVVAEARQGVAAVGIEGEVAAAVHASTVETQGTITHQQAISLILALLTGQTTVAGATYTVKSHNGSATRAVFTLNASKERTAVTLTPSA